MSFDLVNIRNHFPSLRKSLLLDEIYFDNACTTLKPDCVTSAIVEYLTKYPACHNRSAHDYGIKTSRKVSCARDDIKKFVSTPKTHELIFTKNSTDAINLLANFLSDRHSRKILLTDIEHNSNLLPWQRLSNERKTNLVFCDIGAQATSAEIFDRITEIIKIERPSLVSIPHTSHITGLKLPIQQITSEAHKTGALVHIDCAQALTHQPMSLNDLQADFYSFSFHKALGPPGIGALVAPTTILEIAPPLLLGGETVVDADYSQMVLSPVPSRFEAGTQNYVGILGAAAAIRFLSEIDLVNAEFHLSCLTQLIAEEFKKLPRVKLISSQSGIVNFYIDGIDSGELALMLNQSRKIMVRSGYLCGHAWYKKNRLPSTVRASLFFYNSQEEVVEFIKVIRNIARHF